MSAVVARIRNMTLPDRIHRTDPVRRRRPGLHPGTQRIAVGDKVISSAKADIKPW